MNILKIKTAFILGAGLGMRLRPLTKECPKPLLPVGGRPLITFAMDHCLTAGVGRFIVNTHHCPAAYDRAFPEKRWRGRPILFSHEPVLLDTAGGLKNIEGLLAADETLLVYNGDILSDIPLGRLLETHAAGGKEITLVLRSDGPLMNVALDAEGAVCDLRGLLENPGVRLCLFTGIYAVEKRFFRRLTPGKVESIVPVLAEMIRETSGSVGSVVIDEGIWRDIGDPEAYDGVKTSGIKLHYDHEDKGVMMTESPEASCDRISNSTGIRDEACRPAPARKDPPMQKGFAVCGELRDDGKIPEHETFVRTILGLSTVSDMTLAPVGRGGSDRDYFRVTIPGRDPFILMRYGRLREENSLYAAIAGFLREIGVAVPEILGHDPQRGLLLMEDLGNEDLFTNRNAPWDLRRRLYEKTLATVSRLHAFPPGRFPSRDIRLMSGFGPELYRWERDYFREHCVTKTCGICLTGKDEEALEAELEALAGRLLETPPVLVHRDLQSQNVMIRKGEPVLIDFQGMRFGSLFYDLGSLLYDPYVEIKEADRTALLRTYYDLSRPLLAWDEFESLFPLASAQRLMQALGAYGFLGREQGKSRFLAHIAPALDRLIDVTGRTGTLPRLHALARRCRASVHSLSALEPQPQVRR
ncbi:MAG: phosphotransferase [Syntrophales bacterium]|nr:phosphotransferase [Syntrophales bacterium]